jgi:hypothetical protein
LWLRPAGDPDVRKLIACICLLGLLVAPPAAIAKKKKPVVKSRVTVTFVAPAPGQRTVTISGQVSGAKGCQAGRIGQMGSLSGGSAPPTQPVGFAADGSFAVPYTVSGPGTVDLFVAVLPSKRKRAGKKITCGPTIIQASVPFS